MPAVKRREWVVLSVVGAVVAAVTLLATLLAPIVLLFGAHGTVTSNVINPSQ